MGHPNPGTPYLVKNFPRLAFLPDSDRGKKILTMLNTAFKRRLTFKIGWSATHGEENCVVWSDIEHKTEPAGEHSYPDHDYLDRVQEALHQHGITGYIY